ncbi:MULTISPECIES: ExeA family protein [Vibrio]|uniref:ExeA family protein n=1 Tax=Vibrio TaxID=662 RepID=UPI001A8C2AE2|nr:MULTISPECIES: ExeA family protein [Vibrio]MBO0209341.1 ExeA family protein [Vibrio sp. Vb0877]MCR9684324.1 ExeA family protein [Vibrio antiquarius]MDL2006866.1 ExeA family protein [Vibrio parahaemolyticus]MDU9596074.1 AAA family ATPase [Vibrio sp. 2-1-2a]MDU9605436.1 AAA family ATPase [Vibrio sp. 1-2-3a]
MITLRAQLDNAGLTVQALADYLEMNYSTVHRAVRLNEPPKRRAQEFTDKVEAFFASNGLEGISGWSKVAANDQPEPQLEEINQDIELENQMLTQEAMKHFKLFRNPFINDIRGVRDIYLNEDSRYVLAAMKDVARNQGILAVVGDSGAGKSVLRRLLLDELHNDGDISVIQPKIIDKTRATAAGICDAIINDISSETPKRSMEAKARQVERLLMTAFKGGQRHVLIIEEAHDLTIPVMKYLKRFWELEDGFSKLLGILLVGQTELFHRLDERRHYELREFIRRCMVVEVPPLDHDIESYLKHKFERAGCDYNKIMDPNAASALKERLQTRRNQSVSLVYPQVINNLITKAMNLCASLDETKVTDEIIKEL